MARPIKGLDDFMNVTQLLENYGPLLVVMAWFGYKWLNSRRVMALLPQLKKEGAVFVDVRSASEFATANAPGTVNIPLPELGRRLGEITKTAPVVLCCASGTRSGMASLLLKKNGYSRVYNVGRWTQLLG